MSQLVDLEVLSKTSARLLPQREPQNIYHYSFLTSKVHEIFHLRQHHFRVCVNITNLVHFKACFNTQNSPSQSSTVALVEFFNQEFPDVQLDLEKTEEPEIKLPTSIGSQKKQEHTRNISTSASLTMLKPLNVWITTNCGKILTEMGIIDPLTCFLRKLHAGQEATVITGCGTTYWFQIGKGVCKNCILSSCLFKLYEQYLMQNARLDESQAGIKISGRNISNLRYAVIPPLWQNARRN